MTFSPSKSERTQTSTPAVSEGLASANDAGRPSEQRTKAVDAGIWRRTSYQDQIAYLRIIKSRQAHVHLKAVASDTLTAEQAAHESDCLSDIIEHLEMVAGCEGCADTFPKGAA